MDILAALQAQIAASFVATPPEVAALRLGASILLAGLIGVEREIHAKAAGLRTHILVSLAACLFALIALELMALSATVPSEQRTDPLRLIEAVTAGVAFLAAGSIIVSRGNVRGLTTGAGLWLAGAIGLACGVGKLALAVIATVLALVVLGLFKALSERLGDDR